MFFVLLFFITSSYAFAGIGGRRVYGGGVAQIQNFPYQVQIVPSPRKTPKATLYSSCGGTMIGQRVVLTAKHCLRKGNNDPNRYYVRAGTSYRSGLGGSLHRIVNIINYPDYRRQHSSQDLSILFIDPPFQYDHTRQPIPLGILPPSSGERAISSGWGRIDLKKKIRPNTLRSVHLRVMSQQKCNRETKWSGMIELGTFCAGTTGKTATCKGDSGGPLVIDGKLVGVVSWGYSKLCAQLGRPSVFTNVSTYLPWIEHVTKGSDVTYV